MEECNCEWLSISYNGYSGYISTKYLRKAEQVGGAYCSYKQDISSSKKYINKSRRSNYRSNNSYNTYTNSFGERVQSPTRYDSQPQGATAKCRDGTYSFSRNRRGTCSRHGGVARWL